MPQVADVVVVGGGVIGASIAFHLAQRGAKNIVLVEKETLASGPTGKSSAILRQHYSNETTARMAFESLQEFQNFSERVGGDSGYVKTGFFMIVSPKDNEGLEENVAMQQGLGIETTVCSARQVAETMPQLFIDDFSRAAYEPQAGHADPALTTTAYAQGARRLGTLISQQVRAIRLKETGQRVTAVETDQGVVHTPAVVVAAGPWTPALVEPLGVALPIHACRAQIANLQRGNVFGGNHPIVADFLNNIYFRPEAGDQTLVGSVDSAEAEDRVPDLENYKEAIDAAFRDAVLGGVEKRIPVLADGHFSGGWVGLYDITPDWHPVIDQVGPQGLFVAAGFSGHGFKLAPAVGNRVAGMVLEGKHTVSDLNFFRYERFAKGELIRGKYEYGITG